MEAREPDGVSSDHLSRVSIESSGACPQLPFDERSAVRASSSSLWQNFSAMEAGLDAHEGRVATISREVVVLLKNLVGRGPTKARTYIHDDCVLLILREGHTRSEETLFEAGSGRAVAQGRVDMSETIREPLVEVIERHLGRKVVGFMSSSQQDPDLLSFVFVLDSSLLVAVPDESVD